MYKILIVEDDYSIAELMKIQIESWGNQVQLIENFQNVLQEFIAFDPHMVLLDIMLPFYNGYHWCDEIRKISKVPIVFISSASDNMNIVMAMNMGGDDFIPKPVDFNVMIAKIQAVLRRTYDMAGQVPVLENKGKIVSRDTLMTRLWQMDSYIEENTLTVNVGRLRKKLEEAGLKDFITTKVGSGYMIE